MIFPSTRDWTITCIKPWEKRCSSLERSWKEFFCLCVNLVIVLFERLLSSAAFWPRTPYHCCIRLLLFWKIIGDGIFRSKQHFPPRFWYARTTLYPTGSIDAAIDHMIRFRSDKRDLPVLWHQTLLCFVRHYKSDISSEQKEAILDLIKIKSHWQISDVIRKELFHSKPRDEEVTETEPVKNSRRSNWYLEIKDCYFV